MSGPLVSHSVSCVRRARSDGKRPSKVDPLAREFKVETVWCDRRAGAPLFFPILHCVLAEEPDWPLMTDGDEAEEWLTRLEALWRDYYAQHGPRMAHAENESAADVLEVGLFAFGIMASIMRTIRALSIMVEYGYTVESRAMFRSTIDQALALTAIERTGVHGVHAFGLIHAYNLKQLLESSSNGFPLGDVNEEYISKFLALRDELPTSEELKRAQNLVKTSTAGRQSGHFEAMLYQIWLEATPLSKPSMRLADAYVQPEMVGDGIEMQTFLDSDPDSVVDPRIVLGVILPAVLTVYGRVMRDDNLTAAVKALAAEWGAERLG